VAGPSAAVIRRAAEDLVNPFYGWTRAAVSRHADHEGTHAGCRGGGSRAGTPFLSVAPEGIDFVFVRRPVRLVGLSTGSFRGTRHYQWLQGKESVPPRHDGRRLADKLLPAFSMDTGRQVEAGSPEMSWIKSTDGANGATDCLQAPPLRESCPQT